jgi:hypothetical protein
VLYPLAAGRRWSYQVTRGDGTATIAASVTAVEGNSASIVIADPSGGYRSSITVQCLGDELSGFSPLETGVLFFASDASLEIQTVSGRLAPAEREFIANDWNLSWTTGLTASGRMASGDPFAGGFEMIFRDAPGSIEWGINGPRAESVTVPAGTFPNAVKVTANARFDLLLQAHLESGDQVLPAVLIMESWLWYQPKVGLIRQLLISPVVNVGGLVYPLNIKLNMELQEYNFTP